MTEIISVDATTTPVSEAEKEHRLVRKRAKRRAEHGRAMAMRQVLLERFPNCFGGFMLPKKPLALGIHRAILAQFPEEQHVDIKLALRNYTRGPTYLRELVEGAARVDLDGNTTSYVNAEQARISIVQLREVLAFRRSRQIKQQNKRWKDPRS